MGETENAYLTEHLPLRLESRNQVTARRAILFGLAILLGVEGVKCSFDALELGLDEEDSIGELLHFSLEGSADGSIRRSLGDSGDEVTGIGFSDGADLLDELFALGAKVGEDDGVGDNISHAWVRRKFESAGGGFGKLDKAVESSGCL